jgi:hypothetical protein
VNGNLDRRLLLGTVDWERDDWCDSYYPPDLPEDWRLSYYANDCDCVMLPAERWCGAANSTLQPFLEDPPEGLRLFLEAPHGEALGDSEALDLFAGVDAVVLTRELDPTLAGFPQWLADHEGVWADMRSGDRLVRWTIAHADLRALRVRAEQLPEQTAALVLDGPGSTPQSIPELRTLLELLGR